MLLCLEARCNLTNLCKRSLAWLSISGMTASVSSPAFDECVACVVSRAFETRAQLPTQFDRMLCLRHRGARPRPFEAGSRHRVGTPSLRPPFRQAVQAATLPAHGHACSTTTAGIEDAGTTAACMQSLHAAGGTPSHSTQLSRGPALSRRAVNLAAVTLAATLAAQPPPQAAASKLPAFDQAWESMGGGPADLYFPELFLGVWDVTSVLVSVDKPLGDDFIVNKAPVERAIKEDLQQQTRFRVKYMPVENHVVFDRRYNTAAMLEMYYDNSTDMTRRITWEPTDPNVLLLSMPGGLTVRTRVTRRSATSPGPDRLETSEYFEQVYDDGVSPARIKANQCFTKYKWRDPEVAAKTGGPTIVATQVVSDFLTAFDGESLYMQARNRPITIYTYKMAFTRPSQQQA